jgi:hypothetical protein
LGAQAECFARGDGQLLPCIAAHNLGQLTALSHGNIVRLHATVRQGTIGYENTICLASLYKAVTGLPQHPRKK